jgi:8-oxo-dGTP diphosphatase
MKARQVFVDYDRRASSTEGRFSYCPFCGRALTVEEIDHRPRPACGGCGFVQYQNPAPTVSVLVVAREQILLGRRRSTIGGGRWALPSGYIEYDDDFLTTGIQEVKEETGLDVEIESIVTILSSFYAPGCHFLSIFLLARVIGGELKAADDLEEVEWFPLTGPLPEMAFVEDVHVIETYAATRAKGLAVDPRYACRRRDSRPCGGRDRERDEQCV